MIALHGILHQQPFALQLLAFEEDMKLSFVVTALDNFVGPDVPHHHGPAAILALRNRALEIEIFEGMIFSSHRQPLLSKRVRWTLRHCPRLQDAVHLQAEVVMQVAGCVLLDDETPPPALMAAARR